MQREINQASRGSRQWRHKERRAGVCVAELRQLEADIRIRPQRNWSRRRRSDVLASDPGRSLGRRKIRGDRTAGCKSRLHFLGKPMPVSRNGLWTVRRRTRGMQCPRRAALEACLGRCMVRRWIHHAASGKGLGRQSPRMDSRWHSCPTPLSWPRDGTFVVQSRVLRARKVARGCECGLSQ